ncbi:MAG: 3-phosphoshikimate 1-carboxyvinyltransferase [Desulfurococcales archaeon]|nr:3-phosphoshikimate 1-carboxyvinyltransferase [Desulfurococcales archaeon]
MPSKLIVHPSTVKGSVRAPPSKSYTHRAVFAAMLADGTSVILYPLLSGDTLATITVSRAMGARVRVERVSERLYVEGRGWPEWPVALYASGSATTLRVAMALASLVMEPTTLYGDDSLNRRPVEPLARALRGLGARVVTSPRGTPPVLIRGFGRKALSRNADVDAGVSSQFVTALLYIAPLLDLTVTARRISSRPYVMLTLRVMEGFGVKYGVEWREGRVTFTPRGSYKPAVFRVPGDWSSASFMLVAGAIAGRVRVEGVDLQDPQGDKAVVEVLRAAGAIVRAGEGWVEAESSGRLEPFEADLRDTPDLAPPLAVLAAYARGTSILRGVGRLRFKESDRAKAIVYNLTRLGVEARITCDGDCIEVDGRGSVDGGVVEGFGDHRIIMAFAVAGLGSRKPVIVEGAGRFSDSYPDFLEHLKALGGRVEVK